MGVLKKMTEAFMDSGIRKSETRTLGSIIIALSGILLFSDKIFELLGIQGSSTFGFTTFSNFIWVFTQSIAPVIMIIGFLLRPYLLSLLIPLYCYTIQIVWVFKPEMYYDNPLLHTYAFGSCLIFFVLMVFINKYTKYRNKKHLENKRFIEETRKTIALLRQEILEDDITK